LICIIRRSAQINADILIKEIQREYVIDSLSWFVDCNLQHTFPPLSVTSADKQKARQERFLSGDFMLLTQTEII